MKKQAMLLMVTVFLLSQINAHAASVTGKIAFDGQAPAASKLKLDADPNCKAMHPDGIDSDAVVVNANGTLKNVFVYVKAGLEGKKFDAPATPVVFTQHGCQYSPKVFGIQPGQELQIVNDDATLHNVHSLAKNSAQFNLGMPLKGMKLKKKFDKPEVMVKIKCEVHPWMAAYAGVVDNPYYAVSGDDGSFEIKDLPAGKYTIEAWHEKYGVQTQEIEVADQGKEANFTFKA